MNYKIGDKVLLSLLRDYGGGNIFNATIIDIHTSENEVKYDLEVNIQNKEEPTIVYNINSHLILSQD